MESDESKSPWDDLVEDLGAEPSPEAFERKQAPPTELPSTEISEDIEQPQAAPSDWNALAGELGLEVSEPEGHESLEEVTKLTEEEPTFELSESANEEQTIADPETSMPDEESGEAETVDFSFTAESESESEIEARDEALEEASTPEKSESSQDQPNLFDTLDRTLNALESTAEKFKSSSNDDAETDSAEESQDEETSEKKSLRGITGDAARSAFDALFSIGASAWGSAMRENPFDSEPREIKFSDEIEKESSDEESLEDEEAPKARRKRSRRRGGRRRKSEDDRVETEDEITSSQESDSGEESELEEGKKPRRRRSRRRKKVPKSDDLGMDVDDMDSDEFSDDEEDSDGGARKTRTFHRNLPTWTDAIGVIVDSNIELHSKSTEKTSSSRGRGGRGRGGRGRGKSKKS